MRLRRLSQHMNVRSKRGGTLALIVTSTIGLVLLGICFFFLAKIFGGEKEIQHATDSGNLNVAKQALRRPSVALQNGPEMNNFGTLGDAGTNGQINLLTFNRLYAMTLMASINAARDPGPGNIAVTHAQQMIQLLNGNSGVGSRLKTELAKKDGNQLFQGFHDTAQRNSLRMLGNQSALGHHDNAFETSFCEQQNEDISATNLEVFGTVASMFPADLKTTKNGRTYLRGYRSRDVGHGLASAGVPVQPGDQPHLLSERTFQAQKNNPVGTLVVPPNSFRSTAFAQEEKSGAHAGAVSCALVGSLNVSYPASIPAGYIEVINGPEVGSGLINVNGPFAGLDHVLNNELLPANGGILVSGPVFSDNPELLDQWATYNKHTADGQDPGNQPPLNGLYNHQGDPATLNDAQRIPWSGSARPDGTYSAQVNQCTDANVTGNDPSTVDPQCAQLFTSGAFDKAYHPTGAYSENLPPSNGLMAIECAKCKLQSQFNACGSLDVSSCNETGLRTFNRGGSHPSSAMGQCKVSTEGSIRALGNHVQDNFGNEIMDFLRERIQQMAPDRDANTVLTQLEGMNLPLGTKLYIYSSNPNTGGPVTISTDRPQWFTGQAPDGTARVRSFGPYNLVLDWVNPHHDGGIHDIMYREHPGGGIDGVDTASYTPSSGFNNMLGRVQFTNRASGAASGFCKPN